MSTTYKIEYQSDGSGTYIEDFAGEALPKHSLVYRDALNHWRLADADDASKQPILGLTLHAIASGAKGQVLLSGYVADTAWVWNVGGPTAVIYASATPGALTQTAPALVRVIGTAYSATSIMFSPEGVGGLGGSDPESEASYIIWSGGSTYYAKNGHTGAIDYQGTDAGAVINSALTAAAALGTYAGRMASVVIVGSGSSFVSAVAIVAQSNVDVYCVGAEIVVDSAATVNGVNFASVTNSVWRDVVVRRRDTAPIVAAVHAAYFSGTCDSTLRVENCRFLNEVTAAVSSCYGIYVGDSASPTFTGSTGTGGGGGTDCHGIYVTDSASPTFTGSTGTGGGGGTDCYGILVIGSASPTFTGSTGTGGGGGTGCYGIYVTGSASPTFTGSTGTGGGGGTDCYGIRVSGSVSPTFTGSTGMSSKRTNYWWTYASANNGRFQPYVTAPYILVGVYIQVTVAAGVGTTLSLGTSIAGAEIAAGIPIATTGAKYFNIANAEVAAAGYMYATPSAGIAEGSLSVRYVVMTNYATSYGLYLDTRGAARFAGGTLLANGASDAFYATDNAEAGNAWRLTDTHCETLDPVNQRSIISQSAYNPAPVYNCFLRGLVVNIVPAAGTAVGSNIQE